VRHEDVLESTIDIRGHPTNDSLIVWKKIGMPKGSIGKSKLDPYREFIENERKFNAPVILISRKLKAIIVNCTRQNLMKYRKAGG